MGVIGAAGQEIRERDLGQDCPAETEGELAFHHPSRAAAGRDPTDTVAGR